MCPPSAAVRQRKMAFSTFRCSQVNHFWLLAKKLSPAARTTSATSMGGRGIYSVPAPGSRFFVSSNESSGLAVALRWRFDRCRYMVVGSIAKNGAAAV